MSMPLSKSSREKDSYLTFVENEVRFLELLVTKYVSLPKRKTNFIPGRGHSFGFLQI